MSEVLDTARLILSEVARAKKLTKTNEINEIFLSAQTINSGLAYLTGPLVDAEQAYRLRRVRFLNDGMSAAAAETHAKASDEYAYWRKLDLACEAGREQINLLKRFGPLLQAEYQRA